VNAYGKTVSPFGKKAVKRLRKTSELRAAARGEYAAQAQQ